MIIHTLYSSLQYVQNLSVCCIFTSCPLVRASNAIASSVSMFTFCCLATLSQLPPLLTVVSRLFHNRRCFSFYSISMGHRENTSPKIYSIVASHSYHADRIKHTSFQLLLDANLLSSYRLFAEPFPSNGCLCWFDSSSHLFQSDMPVTCCTSPYHYFVNVASN
jgi:hypothetical protein